jgi:hypothetical protein
MTAVISNLQTEEQIVAELERLGVRYLSRQMKIEGTYMRAPDSLLAELITQPSSRVRLALIALLLARPDYAAYAASALRKLGSHEAQTFKFFYTAAAILQRQYAKGLRDFLGVQWLELPDLFSDEIGVTGTSPAERLRSLAQRHAQWSGVQLNWAGTYESAARHLLRRWEVEKQWAR